MRYKEIIRFLFIGYCVAYAVMDNFNFLVKELTHFQIVVGAVGISLVWFFLKKKEKIKEV